MYQALGENWALTDDDNSHRIQGIIIFDHKEYYDAWHQYNNFSQTMGPRMALHDLGHVFDRQAIVGHPTDTTCVVKRSYEDQYWPTRAKQLHGIQSFYKAFNSVNDESFFFISLNLSAAACDGNLVCNAAIGLGSLQIENYIAPKVGKFCNSIVGDVPKDCGTKGGITHVNVNGKNYDVEAFETQENGNLCGNDSKDTRFHQTCDSDHCTERPADSKGMIGVGRLREEI
ncbi:hypothetical protein MBLNU13_g07954t1 [Cladosporium sp. NU13]